MAKGGRDKQVNLQRKRVERKVIQRLIEGGKKVNRDKPGESSGADKPGKGDGKR